MDGLWSRICSANYYFESPKQPSEWSWWVSHNWRTRLFIPHGLSIRRASAYCEQDVNLGHVSLCCCGLFKSLLWNYQKIDSFNMSQKNSNNLLYGGCSSNTAHRSERHLANDASVVAIGTQVVHWSFIPSQLRRCFSSFF